MRYLFLSLLTLTTIALANPSSNSEASFQDVISTRLCNYWRYNFEINDYVCGSRGITVQLAEARDIERKIVKLEARIRELESRLLNR